VVEILQRDAVHGSGRGKNGRSEKLPGVGWVGQEDDKLPRVGVWRRVAVIRRRATHDKVRKAVAVHVRSIETNDVVAGKR
jgi:hypothetical protein